MTEEELNRFLEAHPELKAEIIQHIAEFKAETQRLREKNDRLHKRLAEVTGEPYQGGPSPEFQARLLPKFAGRVINPGDPDWKPSPKFVPPAGFKMPDGWGWTKQSGWFRTKE